MRPTGLVAALLLAPSCSAPQASHPPVDAFETVAEQLVAAAAFGDLDALDSLLLQGADPNAEPDYSTSAAVKREVIPPGCPVCALPSPARALHLSAAAVFWPLPGGTD